MLRRFESVFQVEKKFFLKKHFFEIFDILATLTANTKAALRAGVITKHQKVFRY